MSRVFVDSSVWIDLVNDNRTVERDLLFDLIVQKNAMLGDLVLLEVLQGFHADHEFRRVRDSLLGYDIVRLGGRNLALQAAANYRFLRAKGVTVRKTIDMMIGTWCIMNQVPLLHSDRDFDPLEEHLGLQVWRG